MARAAEFQSSYRKVPLSDEAYIDQAANCTQFVADRGYATRPANAEEADFPIAFSILLYRHVEQAERLLRAIYRPQNIYCLHVDQKALPSMHDAIDAIASCFENVFVLKPSISVRWGKLSVLEPDLGCMRELLRRDKNWTYFINLTGQEFPLKTNWQIVRILKAFNGANNIDGSVRRRNKLRYKGRPPPPFNITVSKGAVHITATRGFVDFALNNEKAIEFMEWVKLTDVPDETFFSTLNHNPQLNVPGAYLGTPETDNVFYNFMTRFKNWGNGAFNFPCHGRRVRILCVYGIGDLPMLSTRRELFVNKLHLDYEPLTLDCLEQLHYERVRDQLLAGDAAEFNTTMYSEQDFVKNHV
jgi:hypothetical protein